ncbi:MAG: hypothetical protein ACR2OL_08235, partial [Anderseniella sp.]
RRDHNSSLKKRPAKHKGLLAHAEHLKKRRRDSQRCAGRVRQKRRYRDAKRFEDQCRQPRPARRVGPRYGNLLPGHQPVSSNRVGHAYAKSVEGAATGQVINVE